MVSLLDFDSVESAIVGNQHNFAIFCDIFSTKSNPHRFMLQRCSTKSRSGLPTRSHKWVTYICSTKSSPEI